MPTVQLLDYVAGNVRSLANAIEKLGYTIEWIKEPQDIEHADVRGELRGSIGIMLSIWQYWRR